MSIDPEVPYEVDLDSIVEEENWRDQQIVAYHLADDQDFDEPGQVQAPDDSWLIPTDFTLEEVLGKGRFKLEEIRRDTSTSLKFNESLRQIDIWGDRESLKRARRMLDLIVERLQQHKDVLKPKSRKWVRPERELTKAERKRADRKLAKRTEDKTYREYPDVPYQFKGMLSFPDRSIPSSSLFGVHDEYLNRLRAECKCYMRYNDAFNTVELTAPVEANVVKAGKRMRAWYLQFFRTPKVSLIHVLKQPTSNMVVQFRTLPPDFLTFRYALPAEEQAMQGQGRLLEGLTTGVVVDQIGDQLDLISLDDERLQEDANNELPDKVESLDQDNIKEMEKALELGLESVRLSPWEMKMKVRFGHIVLTQYPRQNVPRSLGDFCTKVLPNKNFEALFAPCIAKSMEELDDAFDWLSSHGTAYADSPSTSYVIEAKQFPTFVEQQKPNLRAKQKRSRKEKDEEWKTTLIVKFTAEKRVGIWRCLTQSLDVTTIRSADLQSDCDWELKLQRAVHMPKGEMRGTPHGLFADGLGLNPETERLVFYPKSRCYSPELITQKTKWTYAYQDDWSIELTRDEIWDVSRLSITPDCHDLPFDLSAREPHRVIFKLALYRDQWVTRFAENLLFELGEEPSWVPATFIRNPKNNKDTLTSIIDVAQTVKKILNRKCLL